MASPSCSATATNCHTAPPRTAPSDRTRPRPTTTTGRPRPAAPGPSGPDAADTPGFTGGSFFPGRFYDHPCPIALAGGRNLKAAASDPPAGSPADNGGINKVPGDWHETMSTHWFHDHM